MRKVDEIGDPDSCFNKARNDEFLFVLLGRDVAAPATVREWAHERVRLGKNTWADAEIIEALEWADAVEDGINALKWSERPHFMEAWLGHEHDGVHFTLQRLATCYRRGPWRLDVEVQGGQRHQDWGCFDEADQPVRHFHSVECAKAEAEAIAKVLLADRLAHGPIDPEAAP